MPEKDYTYNQQLLLEAVKSTWGIPTAALSVIGVTTGFLVAPALRLSWDTLLATPKQVEEILDNAAEEVRKKVVQAIKPAVQFQLDVRSCMNLSLVGKTWIPAFSDGRFHACMALKGYAGDTIQAALKTLAKSRA